MGSSSATTLSDSAITRTWQRLRGEHRAGLVPYLTAGHPTPEVSVEAIRVVATHADVLEVGVPFSDPLADGPTIQASSLAALRQGVTLERTLALIAEARPTVPVVLFSYLNPVLQYGVTRLIGDAVDAGVSGILLTDLPAGADPALEEELLDSPLDLIRLVAPNASSARVAAAVARAEGFIYLLARLGVTGASATLDAGLEAAVARARAATALPVAVGFGISTAAQARAVARLADGVVVGSALVDALERGGVSALERSIRDIASGLHPE
jgi:tryptophan synthase alpha chain